MKKPLQTRQPKTRIEDLRRRELIDAAHRVFLTHGLDGLTTASICAEAGMSPGILSYSFRGKDEVMYAMVRQNNRALAKEVVARLRLARSRWDRLSAIIEGNFPESYFDSRIANAWLSVCAASGREPRYARLQGVFHARLASNIASALPQGTTADLGRRQPDRRALAAQGNRGRVVAGGGDPACRFNRPAVSAASKDHCAGRPWRR
jgi:TetR/AcrR family transcriptional regulator, transcriptional repressor of bet genes